MRSFGALLLALVLSGVPVACAKSAPISVQGVDGGAPIDTEVMAYLSEARALHHEANLREEDGDLPGAVQALQRLVQARTPHAGERIPEVDEVIADTYARLADLQLRQHDLAAADRAVQSGLEHASEPTYFRGHLLEVRGVIEEARASALADAGDTTGAAAARARAIALLDQVVRIQEQVVARSLAGDGGSNGGQP